MMTSWFEMTWRKLDSRLRGNDGRREACRLTPLVSLLLLLLLVLSGCEKKVPPKEIPKEAKSAATKPEEAEPAEINLKEIKLASIPEDYEKWGNVSFSADGRQVFYIAKKGGKDFVVTGDKPGPAYDGVFFFVRSSDGRRFAFGGKKGEKKHLVFDNKELKDLYHEEVAPGAFSPDGRLVACEVGGFNEKKWFIVVSDGEKEVYRSRVYPDTYRSASFSPDGRVLVFELGDDKRNSENKNKKRTVFFFDVSAMKIIKERLCDGCETGGFSFASDSSRVIYDVRKEGKNFFVLNDFVLKEEREVLLPYAVAGKIVLSPDGKKIAYIAAKEGKHFLVVSLWESPAQGKETGPYEEIASPVFVPGSTTVVCLALKKGKWRIVVGGKEGGANYNSVGDAPVFSPNGAIVAYPAMKGGHQDRRGVIGGKWVMVVSDVGKPAAAKEGLAYDMVVSPVFSSDGKYIAYRARTGTMKQAKRFIVIADAKTGKVIKEGHVSEEIWPLVWSADGKTVAYGARIGRELWWKVEAVK